MSDDGAMGGLPGGDPALSLRLPFPAEPGVPFTVDPASSFSSGVFSFADELTGIPCSSSNTPAPQQHPDISQTSYTSVS